MMQDITMSLCDILGRAYAEAVCAGRAALTGESRDMLMQIAEEKVSFYPDSLSARLDMLAGRIGQKVAEAAHGLCGGAPSDAVRAASRNQAAPLSGFGCYRAGEDGRLYFTAKSEHYHIPLGHAFPGYDLIGRAQRLGIPNATHNNTRGHVTRLLESELVRTASGIGRDDVAAMDALAGRREPGTLNRVINLETGSLAAEAALKMMLARFYPIEKAEPAFPGKVPVFLVMGGHSGEPDANYHGTTIIAQTLRGMWPAFRKIAEESGLYKVVPVRINDIGDFEKKVRVYNTGCFKTAGFCHEIILMNYGGICLSKAYLQAAYRLCRETGTPVLCDEIQTGAWSPELFMFRELGLSPDFAAVGKGLPGGTSSASRILFSAAFDNLTQFGALVTNGQEELSSLACLITMAFVEANRQGIRESGEYYMQGLNELAGRHPGTISGIDGAGLIAAVRFADAGKAERFCKFMNAAGIDISAQTGKAGASPSALTKLPLIVSETIIDAMISKMEQSLEAL